MMSTTIAVQLLGVLVQYKKEGWRVKLREALITLSFLRPGVDAYRVSSNHTNASATMDSMTEMIINKCTELAFEVIPGTILQLYVWLTNLTQAGSFSLASICIGAMTTGFSSATIAFDMDVSLPHRKNQPIFMVRSERRVREHSECRECSENMELSERRERSENR